MNKEIRFVFKVYDRYGNECGSTDVTRDDIWGAYKDAEKSWGKHFIVVFSHWCEK